jgi:hypothetical protein
MPPSTRGRKTTTPPPPTQKLQSKRVRKPTAKLIDQQETWDDLEDQTITVTVESDRDVSLQPQEGSNPKNLSHLLTELKTTISRQSKIIENARAELIEIKSEQRNLKGQNVELREEIRCLRAQLDSFSTSPPSTRSWASVAAGGRTTQLSNASSFTSLSPSNTKNETQCVRISTQARQSDDVDNGDATNTFGRYLSTNNANEHIRSALEKTNATKEVRVAGVGTTKTGYVIRFKCPEDAEKARTHPEWLGHLGNDTKLVRPRFGVVVHRAPTAGIPLMEHKKDAIQKMMDENDLAAKGFRIQDIAWLKAKDKSLGPSASLGVWLDTEVAAQWIIDNGMVFGQRYVGSVEAYQIKKKRCHRCQGYGHLAWSCKERARCGHCAGQHERRNCPPYSAPRCIDCDGPHPTGTRECLPGRARGSASTEMPTVQHQDGTAKRNQYSQQMRNRINNAFL